MDFMKVRGETAVPSFVRKEPPDQFIKVCDINSSAAYADMGTADCMKADNTTFSYAFLLDTLTNGH